MAKFRKLLLLILVSQVSLVVFCQQGNNQREHLLMDFNWRFAFGHPYDAQKDFGNGTGYFSYFAKAGYGDGAAAANFDDRAWRKLDIPHDWAVEQDFSPRASFSHGFKSIGRPFPEKSVGWYRKNFTIPSTDLGKRMSIVFEGVFRNSIVWVNGHYLGTEQSGYNSFQYDITDVVNYGGNNIIAVRVDATMEEGWFYEGAGIYRHVWLNKTNPVHVEADGTFVTSRVNGGNAVLTAKAAIVNDSKEARTVNVMQSVVDANGNVLAKDTVQNVRLPIFETKEIASTLRVNNARLWNIDTPYLYKLITSVSDKNGDMDRYETPFGIRTIDFDAKAGFFLNGKHLELKGTNNHQDHAGLGTAIPDELQYWRIKALKAMGTNAYRCSHNPPSPALLDACDRLGMLVVDENRLMRTTAEGVNDLKRMIMRDRNHPSVICWSIGNEEWAIENNNTGERIATTLQAFVKNLDSTRPVTAAVSGGFRSGISDVVELVGYNYLGNGDIDAHHKRFPGQPGMGTEEGSTYATRGIYITDDANHYRAAYDQKPRPTFYSIEEGWKFYAARPYLAGMFIWTGFDYRGEPTPYGWPSVTSYFGMMDLCGFPKDNAWYLKSWWGTEPILHLFPHWNWGGQEGKIINVWVYSNCDEVELFLNNKSLGRKKMDTNGHLEWAVAYSRGSLEAIAYKDGKKLMRDVVQTTGDPVAIRLTPHKKQLSADGEDVSIITVDALDNKGLPVPTAGNEITFSLHGPGKIIGVGNGDPTSLEKDKFLETIQTFNIENLKEKELSSIDDKKEATAVIDDANWKEAFKDRDYKKLPKAYVYRGSFMLPENISTSVVTFFYKNIGREQSIFVNGKNIATNLKEDETANGFVLDPAILKTGQNVISILATPIPKKYEWDNVNTDPGLIQVVSPAEPWRRKLFSGKAQLIVQSTSDPGVITITASSAKLKSSVLTLEVKKVDSRMSMSE